MLLVQGIGIPNPSESVPIAICTALPLGPVSHTALRHQPAHVQGTHRVVLHEHARSAGEPAEVAGECDMRERRIRTRPGAELVTVDILCSLPTVERIGMLRAVLWFDMRRQREFREHTIAKSRMPPS